MLLITIEKELEEVQQLIKPFINKPWKTNTNLSEGRARETAQLS